MQLRLIVDYFNNKGKLGFITVLANISLYCDCAGTSAPKPKIKDIGILASVDPVAIDKAGLDLVKKMLIQELKNCLVKLII